MGYLAALAATFSLLLAACGGGDSSAPVTMAAEPPPPEPLTLELKKLPRETTDQAVEVQGVVAEEARVTVNGKRAEVKGERFNVRIPLDLGKSKIRAVATRPGFERAEEVARVIRSEVPVAVEDPPPTGTEEALPDEPAEPTEPCVIGQGGCTPDENEAIREGDNYPDQIPDVPGIQGE